MLFNDPTELVGLLDVMLPKQCAKKASATEEHFLVMLLSYLAKPPVVWRVLQLATPPPPPPPTPPASRASNLSPAASGSALGGGAAAGGGEGKGRPACTRLVECLLDCVLHHFRATASRGGAGGTAEAQVIPNACIDVLIVAWRMQLAHWASLQAGIPDAEHSLKVCSDMATAVLQAHPTTQPSP